MVYGHINVKKIKKVFVSVFYAVYWAILHRSETAIVKHHRAYKSYIVVIRTVVVTFLCVILFYASIRRVGFLFKALLSEFIVYIIMYQISPIIKSFTVMQILFYSRLVKKFFI